MHCPKSIFIASFRYCCIGLVILTATVVSQQAIAQERMMRQGDDRGGGMQGMGTGLAIGIGTGIIVDQLNKPRDATDNPTNAKKPIAVKKVAKKPPPKQDTPKNTKTPDTPPIKQTNNPPLQIPPDNPIPPVAGPPTTTDTPPNKPG